MTGERTRLPDLTYRPTPGPTSQGRPEAPHATTTRPGRSLGRVVVAVALSGCLAGALAAPVSAHSRVVSSTPAPNAVVGEGPARLVLKFDSPLAATGNAVQIWSSNRTSIGDLVPKSDGAAQPTETTDLPKLSPDVYTVGWTSVSGTDGHELKQFFSFIVGAPPAPIAAAAIPPLMAGDTRVSVRVARSNVGPTTFDATVTDANGKPLANLQRVVYRYQPAGLDVGQVDEIAPAKGSTAQTPSFVLGLSGDWQFTVIVRRAGMDDVSAPMTLKLQGITQPTATAVPTASPAPTETPAPTVVAAPSSTQVSEPSATPGAQPTIAATVTAPAPTSSPTSVVATSTVATLPTETQVASAPAQSSALPFGTIGLVGLVAIAAVAIMIVVARRR